MSTGEVLDSVFNLYRRQFVLFFCIALLPLTVSLLLQLGQVFVNRDGPPGGGGALSIALWTAISFVVWFFAYSVAQVATVFAVSAVYLGRETSIRQSYAKLTRQLLLRVFGVDLLTLLVLIFAFFGITLVLGIAVFMIAFTATLFGGSVPAEAMGMAMMVIAFIAILAVASVFAVAGPACVLEELKVKESLRRSIYLTKGGRRRIFVISVLYMVIWYGILWAMLGPIKLVASVTIGETALVFQILAALATVIAQVLVEPIGTISMALIYYDERVRKEAFDLQLMIAALDKPAAAAASGVAAS